MSDLIPWNRQKENEHPFLELHKEMNRLFGNFSHSFFDDTSWVKEMPVTPKMDVVENEKDVQVTLELPGMDEKDVEINLEDDTLVIKGEKKSENEKNKDGYHLMERSYGSFHRTLRVPSGLDSEKIEAKYYNGVLKLTLPKTEEAIKNVKKIEVNKN